MFETDANAVSFNMLYGLLTSARGGMGGACDERDRQDAGGCANAGVRDRWLGDGWDDMTGRTGGQDGRAGWLVSGDV